MEVPERLYPAEFPEVGEIVAAKVTQIDESAVYCQLLEYDREGMIPLKEISRRKMKNIRQFVRVGAQEYLEVIEVNPTKGYIDLSRKQVKGDQEEYKIKYTSVKRVHSFFHRWSVKTGVDLVGTILWSLYDRDQEDVYGKVYTEPWLVRVPVDYRDQIQEDYNKLFEKKAEKRELSFEMVCYSLQGVRALQEAIDKGLQHSTEDTPLQCIYTGKTGQIGNVFVVSTHTKSDNADTVLQTVVSTIKESLSQYRSKFVLV